MRGHLKIIYIGQFIAEPRGMTREKYRQASRRRYTPELGYGGEEYTSRDAGYTQKNRKEGKEYNRRCVRYPLAQGSGGKGIFPEACNILWRGEAAVRVYLPVLMVSHISVFR